MDTARLRNKYFRQYVCRTLKKQGYTPHGSTRMVRQAQEEFLEVISIDNYREEDGSPWFFLKYEVFFTMLDREEGLMPIDMVKDINLAALRFGSLKSVRETWYYRQYFLDWAAEKYDSPVFEGKKELINKFCGPGKSEDTNEDFQKMQNLFEGEVDDYLYFFSWPGDEERIEESFREVQSILENEFQEQTKKFDYLNSAIQEVENLRRLQKLEDYRFLKEQFDSIIQAIEKMPFIYESREKLANVVRDITESEQGGDVENIFEKREYEEIYNFNERLKGIDIENLQFLLSCLSYDHIVFYHCYDYMLAVLYYRVGEKERARELYESAVQFFNVWYKEEDEDGIDRGNDTEDDNEIDGQTESASDIVHRAEMVWEMLDDEEKCCEYRKKTIESIFYHWFNYNGK